MKLKAVFNNETHLITRVPDSLDAFLKSIPAIFLSELPSEWSLVYTDSEGDKILIADEASFQEFREDNKNKTAKVHIIPKAQPIPSLSISNTGNSRKTSENVEQDQSILTESVALSNMLIPAEKAEKISLEREDEAALALSSFRSLNSEQVLQEMIAKAVEKQLAKINVVAPSNEKSIMEKIEELKRLVHQDVRCDGCGMLPIEGIRYKCAVCDSFDFCGACEATKEHQHALIKIKWAGQEYTKPVKDDSKPKASPKKFKPPAFFKTVSFKVPTLSQAPAEANIEAKFQELKHMALLQEIKAVAPKFSASNRLRVSENINIQKPNEQNKLWGGQEKVEQLRLSEPLENAQNNNKKQGHVREEVDMSMFDDFLRWRQQRREDIGIQKDLMKDLPPKPMVRKNYQSDSELDSSNGLSNLLAEIRTKGTQRKSHRYQEESSDLDALKKNTQPSVSDLMAEIRAKGCLRRRDQYKNEISDLKGLEMNMLNQLCKMESPKKSPKKVQFKDSESDTDISQLLAEIRAVGKKKELVADFLGARKSCDFLSEIRAKGKQRKSCEYREDESDSSRLHTLEWNQQNLLEANRRAHDEYVARRYEGLDDSMHDLLEEIRAAKGTVRKEKKNVEKEYSELVRAKAALIKEVFPNLSMKDILEFVSNAPEDLDAEELLANYEL